MEKVSSEDVSPDPIGSESDCRSLSHSLGATDVAINHYRIAPGDGFPSGLHAHGDQAEIFVVLEGQATFDCLGPQQTEANEITVSEGEAVRFAPGEYQSGRNDADWDLVALALGAPPDSEDVRIPLACPECGHENLHPEGSTEEGIVLVCPDCDAENVPQGCPECGHEMQVELGDTGETIVVCPDCGTESANPFDT